MDKERKKDGVMEISCIVQASPSAKVCLRAPIIIVLINIFYYVLQGPPKFSPESVIKDPNQTSLHFYRRSCHPFLRLSQTKYLYYTIFNTDELLMNIWRGPGSICSYGRVVKGS